MFLSAILDSGGYLAEIHKDIAGRMAIYDELLGQNNEFFELDYSDDICAEYIIERTKGGVSRDSIIVIDYLQLLLDQRRVNPELQVQVDRLSCYAREVGCTIIFLSQSDRSVEYRVDQRPLGRYQVAQFFRFKIV